MGKIVKNGVTYSGSSDNADNVKYNNNVSNLDATNVQEAIDKLDESVDTLNSNLSANNNHFYFDYQNGKYGYNTSSSRGADTFHPFSNSQVITISPFTSLSKTIELDFEPSYVAIFTTGGTGYPCIYNNGKIQIINDTVCKIDSINGNKVTFSHSSGNLNWTYVLMAIA